MDHNIQITCRHLKLSDAIRGYVYDNFKKLERHFQNITHIHVTLSVFKVDRRKPKVTRSKVHTAKGLILLPNKHEIIVERASDNLYTSIDLLVGVLDEQLIEINRMMKEHK